MSAYGLSFPGSLSPTANEFAKQFHRDFALLARLPSASAFDEDWDRTIPHLFNSELQETFIDIIRPAFDRDMGLPDIEATLKRAHVIVNADGHLFVREAGSGQKECRRLSFGGSGR